MTAKDTFWFPHDYNARNDRKLLKIIQAYGVEGLGIFWYLIEMLYEEGGYLPLADCECYANAMRTHIDKVNAIIGTELFQSDGERFWSESCLRRLEHRQEVSIKAKESALARWNKGKNNANAMRTQCERNASAMLERREEDIHDRHERKETCKEKKSAVLPDFIKKELWFAFLEMRKKIKKSPTDRAIELLIKDLNNYHQMGEDVNDILEQSIKNNWQGLFPVKNRNNGGGSSNGSRKPGYLEGRDMSAIRKTDGG